MRTILLMLLLVTVAMASNPTSQATPKMTARGSFDVKITPRAADDAAGGPFERLFVEKQYRGDLVATAKGQMLGSRSADMKSGGYVAFELVSGVLNGKRGSFVLQHSGTMKGGASTIRVTVVPDSGTDQLTGIDGTMTIIIEGAKHSYEFEYTLSPASR